jgi:dynein heavy chain
VKYLWAVPKEDEVYLKVRNEISNILDKNLSNVNDVLVIYNKFAYLLEEKQKVSQWTK